MVRSYEAADAVLGVDDDGAFIEPCDFRDVIRATLAALGSAHHAVAENVLLADDVDIACFEALSSESTAAAASPLSSDFSSGKA